MRGPATFRHYLNRYAFAGMARQCYLAEVHGSQPWEVDLERGEITFDGTNRYPVQVLGSESDVSNTWLWAWHNTDSNLPADLVDAARRLRVIGEKEGVREFIEPKSPLDEVTGAEIALISSALLGATAYYRAPYEGGAAFLLLTAPTLPPDPRPYQRQVAEAVVRTLEMLDLDDHRPGLRELSHHLRVSCTEGASHWTLGEVEAHVSLILSSKGLIQGIQEKRT